MGRSWASPAVRRHRRRRAMMWVLTGMTVLALLVIAVMVKDIARTPVVARPEALGVPARTTVPASPRPKASRSTQASASPTGSAPDGQVTDGSSGLSYLLLSAPWRPGCPGALNTPMLSWSAGESAIAGSALIAGSATDWYGNACSAPLQQQFQYSGVFDLEPTAMSLVEALDLAYYSGLPHYRTIEASSEIQVSGHPAWMVTFLMTYPDAAAQGLAWTSEAGAVVVVDRGGGRAPAVFYASVPSNLGISAVDLLIASLRLSSLA